MPHTRIARCLLAALALAQTLALLPSCDGSDAPVAAGGDENGKPEAAASATPATAAGTKGAKPTFAPGILAGGRHAVFGLRMPQGMSPAGSPTPGVYRFEGPHATTIVEPFLTAQLGSFDPPVEEPGSRLFRRALPKKPVGGGDAAPLAIRLHAREGGSAVDVWLEGADEAGAPASAATANGSTASGAGAEPDAPAAKPTSRPGTPIERRRAAYEVLKKVERGEPLSKEDLDNPLFQ